MVVGALSSRCWQEGPWLISRVGAHLHVPRNLSRGEFTRGRKGQVWPQEGRKEKRGEKVIERVLLPCNLSTCYERVRRWLHGVSLLSLTISLFFLSLLLHFFSFLFFLFLRNPFIASRAKLWLRTGHWQTFELERVFVIEKLGKNIFRTIEFHNSF